MHNAPRELHNDALGGLPLRQLARLLGGEVNGDAVSCPGPGHGPKDRSMRVWIDPAAEGGFRVHSFADDWRFCRDHIRETLPLPVWQPNSRLYPKPRMQLLLDGSDERQREKARWLYDQSKAGRDPRLKAYMKARGLDPNILPATFKFLPARPPKHPHPTMIAPFALAAEPEPGCLVVSRQAIAGVHITRLRPDGNGKAGTVKDKIMLGPSMGVPIVVAAASDNLGLAITEGIEDALSVHFATGLGAWAAGSSTRMPALANAVPEHIESVTVVADANEVGQRNAEELARRLFERGTEVDITTPMIELEDAA